MGSKFILCCIRMYRCSKFQIICLSLDSSKHRANFYTTLLGHLMTLWKPDLNNSHLIFTGTFQDPKYAVECPLGSILRVEKVGGSTSRGENAYGLEIFCKVSIVQ